MGIFEPFRALGYVTDGTPFSVQRRGLENYVTVSVGKSWQIYNCAKISLLFVGPQLERKIRALASWRDYTYVATGQSIVVFNRTRQVSIWNGHTGKVILLLAFGKHILSIGTEGRLLIWPVIEEDPTAPVVPVGSIQFRQSFTPTCIVHPDTYLNKVLIGSEEGALQLWNISSQKMIYEFKGWGSPVRSCVTSPALDVVGVGCADGKIHLHNLKYDETVVTFTHTTRGPVTALSFRTDGQPFLAAGGSSGVISIWDLQKRKLQAVIKDAHDGTVSSLQFFANEPVLLSGSVDNSLKMWIFDSSDGEARLLRFRNGHSAPPTSIRYYGNGQNLLSAGLDRSFRFFSTIQDQQSRELSQGHVAKRAKKLKLKEEELKLPPVVGFAAAEIRERDWCNVVTCHMDHNVAYSWRLQNFVIGEHVLKPIPENPTAVKACALSACGNFAVVGTEGGFIERFNLQSGQSRGTYGDSSLEGSPAHAGPVIGLACDATNTLMLSGGHDGNIKVWDFRTRGLQSTISVGSPLVKLAHHPANGLLAVASVDKVIRLYDVVAARLVRVFDGHSDRINDISFSEDGKLLISSSMDQTVRVWDVVAAKPLDAMHVDAAVTALSLSPNMDMLATAHVNRNGIYLWSNRLIYSGSDVELRGSGNSVVHTPMPTVSSHEKVGLENGTSVAIADVSNLKAGGDPFQNDVPKETTQILPTLITLSMLPKSQWQGLVDLDLIKVRNKPTEPPKKPEKAPFFLPTLPSLSAEPVFVPEKKAGGELDSKTTSHLMKRQRDGEYLSQFTHSLHTCAESKNYADFVALMKSMSPSALDAEFRMLQLVDEEDENEDEDGERSKELVDIGLLMDFFAHETKANKEFEFLQALIQLFLKVHGETIIRKPLLQEKARKLHSMQSHAWQRLDSTFQRLRCTVAFLSNAQL
ncbi:U3 small nucleolar RNA-associated protein 21 [Marchantia polymorpha subsp. ruderalis]|uniref:Small-subunit processome Utp21 domain-containing protein n=2 Tax=Marchantia polymorpha TaxID=3197 RepID=A0AAF6B0I2_MARPO|nr:hypothetical protein MARPO_0004s0293 [Marchantia polymorpha]BBN05516.1 hypothetical protein Mp_3g13780 [Marchantia polymorpha subsp. ruderalis]|eukprot:PTQ49069.1 hypothetical protein MARPO_0004s0293 [Marchantia polymorpha]